jgi:hypothetical protein
MAGAKRPVFCGEMFMKFKIRLPASNYSLYIINYCGQPEKTLQFQHTQTHIHIYIYIPKRQEYDLHMPNTNLTVRISLQ